MSFRGGGSLDPTNEFTTSNYRLIKKGQLAEIDHALERTRLTQRLSAVNANARS